MNGYCEKCEAKIEEDNVSCEVCGAAKTISFYETKKYEKLSKFFRFPIIVIIALFVSFIITWLFAVYGNKIAFGFLSVILAGWNMFLLPAFLFMSAWLSAKGNFWRLVINLVIAVFVWLGSMILGFMFSS